MHVTLQDYCQRLGNDTLIQQWHRERNEMLTPKDVSYGSHMKIWWQCEKGHEWQAAVYSRTSGSGCPYCAGKLSTPGVTDLASQHPELLPLWDTERNGTLRPEQVLSGSHRKVWWKCPKGHTWNGTVKSLSNGARCPICTNRAVCVGENDLAEQYPELTDQWHPTRNGPLRPVDVTAVSRRKVWWRCAKGHEWQATVISRTHRGTGCPICTGRQVVPGGNDLKTKFPKIAAEFAQDLNGGITPEELSPDLNRRYLWRCPMGHVYQATVERRTQRGSDCPYCTGQKVLKGFNDLETRKPQLAGEWARDLNGALTPDQVTAVSRKKVWWRCPVGHVWKGSIAGRWNQEEDAPIGCPICGGRNRVFHPSYETQPETEA